MKNAVLFLISLCLWIPVALLSAWSASTLWRWYVAPQYGAGPSIMSWVGVAMLTGVMLARPLSSLHRLVPKDETTQEKVVKAIAVDVGIAFGMLIIIGFAWLFRAVVWGAP